MTIRTARSNLIGGVSQLPEAVRIENQGERQDDAFPSVADGLMKRTPLEHVAKIDQSAYSDSQVYWINLSPTERYLVWVLNDFSDPQGKADHIRIFDIDGTEMTVTGANGGAMTSSEETYCTPSSTSKNLEFLTLRDTTYILNKDILVEKDTTQLHDAIDVNLSTSSAPDYRSASSRRWFYFFRSTGYLREYRVRVWLTKPQGTVQPPMTTTAEKEDNEAIVRTHDGEFGASKNGLPEHEPPYAPNTSPPIYTGFQEATIKPAELAKRLFDRAKKTGSGGDFPGGIQARFSDLTSGLNILGRVTVGDSSVTLPPQNSGVVMLQLEKQVAGDPLFYDSIDMELVEEQAGHTGDLILFSDEIERFTDLPLTCKHGHVVQIKGDPAAEEGEYYVEFEEGPETNTVGNILVQGTWKESRASLSEYALDATTMPHKIVRIEDSAEPKGFRFEVSAETWDDMEVGDQDSNPDPSFVGKSITSMFFWKNRLGFIAGQSVVMSESGVFTNFWRTTVVTLPDSDPIDVDIPSRQGGVPRFAVPLQSSLIIFSDEQQFSVSGQPLLSPSTIAITPSSAFDTYFDVPPLNTAAGVFFAFPSTAGKFSGLAELRRIGDADRYDDYPVTGQVPRYIPGRVVEMAADPVSRVLALRSDDEDSINHLYLYKWLDVGGQRVQSAWFRYRFSLGGTINATPGKDHQNVFEIIGMTFLDNDLYMMVARGRDGGQPDYTIEKLGIADQHQDVFPFDDSDPTDQGDATSAYLTLLDRRITENDCVLSYDFTDRTVKIELPYQLGKDDDGTEEVPMVVSRINSNGGGTEEEGKIYEVESTTTGTASNGDTVSILKVSDRDQSIWAALGQPKIGSPSEQSQDARVLRWFIGIQYEKHYTFSRFNLKTAGSDGSPTNLMTGRWQLLYGTLVFEDTGFLLVEVAPATRAGDGANIVNRNTFVYPASMMSVGEGPSYLGDPNIRDGILRFPLMSSPRLIEVSIRNDSPFPSNVKSVEIEGQYSSRSTPTRV